MIIGENRRIIEVKRKIEKCLQQGEYLLMDEFLNSEEARELMRKDQELYIIGILSEVNKIETHNGVSKCFLHGRSLMELIHMYKEIVLLLRRLEFDLPKEYQVELIDYISKNDISIIAIWAIVQGTKYLYAKELIIDRFKEFL